MTTFRSDFSKRDSLALFMDFNSNEGAQRNLNITMSWLIFQAYRKNAMCIPPKLGSNSPPCEFRGNGAVGRRSSIPAWLGAKPGFIAFFPIDSELQDEASWSRRSQQSNSEPLAPHPDGPLLHGKAWDDSVALVST